MSYTTPTFLSTGDTITAANWNIWLRDNFELSYPKVASAKGDLAVATGSQASANLAIGTNNQVIEADSTQACGMKNSWAYVPVGGIIMWSGSLGSLPANWHLCDGTSGTTDLRDRFIVAAGSSYSVGGNGGSATANLEHDHGGTTSKSSGAHQHLQPDTNAGGIHLHQITSSGVSATTSAKADLAGGSSGIEDHTHVFNSDTESAHTHTKNATASDGAHTHTIGVSNELSSSQSMMPPYYALAFIQRLS